jgi:predicted metal-dependent peptidase/intein/homing endonuclease
VRHCFPAGTIIAGAWKAVEEYGVGDDVIGAGGIHSKVVMPISRHYDGPMVTLKARGLLPLELTPEHPVLVRRPVWKFVKGTGLRRWTNIREWSDPDFVLAQDIRRGDWVAVPRVTGNVSNYLMEFQFDGNPWSSSSELHAGITLDASVAEFLGWYVAEGCTSLVDGGGYHSSLSLNINERPIAERHKILLSERFGIASNISENPESHGCKLQFSSRPLGRWLRKHIGHGALDVRMPDAILYNTNLKVLAAFLSGYIEGDGHTGVRGVGCGTASQTLALQLQIAWARFGILFNLKESPPFSSLIDGKIAHGGVLYRGGTTRNLALNVLGKEELMKRRPTIYSATFDDAIYTPVVKTSVKPFSGMVYNFETTCHTYTAGNVITHNCLYDHVGRRGDRDPGIWGMACDFIVNYGLVREGIGEMPADGLYDADYTDEFSAEELYALLISKCVKVKATLDVHLDVTGKAADPAPGTVTIDPASLDDLQDDFLAALRRAASSEGVGDLPAGLRRLLNQLTAPRINWRQILNATLRSTLKYDYTYARPSRRSHASLLLPGQDSATHVTIACAIDASASTTTEMVTDFLSEIGGIMASFRDYSITVMCFDTKVYNVRTFTPQNTYDLFNYTLQGGGGTAPSCCWSYLRAEKIQPHKLLVFTDGQVGKDWGDPDFCDTVFIIHSNPALTAPYGLTCHFD